MIKKKVFEGEGAISDFLIPGSLGLTPMVELPSSINIFREDDVRIFIKLTQFVPLCNIKSLPSFTMLQALSKKERSKIKNLVGWSPKISLDEGLEKTINWIKENLNSYKTHVSYV